MELLIAHTGGQGAAAIKVASKGFFRVPQKWRQKLPTTEIKRLERRLVGALAPLIFAQRPLFHISRVVCSNCQCYRLGILVITS